MKKFQDLLINDSQNQIGLKYTSIGTQNRSAQSIRKNDNVNNFQTVEIYVKFGVMRSTKLKVQKNCEISNLKVILQLKTQILSKDQILYLNGRQISEYFSITLNQQQILHVLNRNSIVNQNQSIKIRVLISIPTQISLNNQKFIFEFQGYDKIQRLEEQIEKKVIVVNPENSLSINFLESGRILGKDKTFHQNMLANECNIICLYSQNFVETKFLNQYSKQSPFIISQSQQDDNNFKIFEQEISEQVKQTQNNQFSLKSKASSSMRAFQVGKKQGKRIYSRIQRKSQEIFYQNNFLKPIMKQRKSETPSMRADFSGFKKKKAFEDNYENQFNLITRILVRKSKVQIEKLLQQNSLLGGKTKKNQKKQISSSSSSSLSSSSSKKAIEYISIRKQKQYRPCPLITQRTMPQNQKMKINLQLQKLFGFEPKGNFSENNEPQSLEMENECNEKRQNAVSHSMKASVSAKEPTLQALKDRKSNRYAEDKMYDGD